MTRRPPPLRRRTAAQPLRRAAPLRPWRLHKRSRPRPRRRREQRPWANRAASAPSPSAPTARSRRPLRQGRQVRRQTRSPRLSRRVRKRSRPLRTLRHPAAPSGSARARRRRAAPAAAARTQIAAAPATQPATPARTEPTRTGGFMIQLGAPGSEAEARALYGSLQRRHAEQLGGEQPVIRRAEVSGGGRSIACASGLTRARKPPSVAARSSPPAASASSPATERAFARSRSVGHQQRHGGLADDRFRSLRPG